MNLDLEELTNSPYSIEGGEADSLIWNRLDLKNVNEWSSDDVYIWAKKILITAESPSKKEEMIMLARLTVADTQIEQQAIAIGDAVEVIQWYLDFIAVKLQRALQGQLEEAEEPDAGGATPKIRMVRPRSWERTASVITMRRPGN